MISKRTKRYSGPQEKLRQFSLNTSKGIDETRPIIDPNTVVNMKNLTVNPDGSLSLRKRILATGYYGELTKDSKVHVMHTNEHILMCSPKGLNIFNRDGTACTLSCEITDYYTYSSKTFNISAEDIAARFDVSKATFVNTADSTVIGNSFILASGFVNDELKVIDTTLYNTPAESLRVPRYLQIKQSETDINHFTICVKNPELTTLNTAEGEIPLNPNMCLDNPYAIRDIYNSSSVQVLGMIPYVYEGKLDTSIMSETSEIDVDETADSGFENSQIFKVVNNYPDPFFKLDTASASILFRIRTSKTGFDGTLSLKIDSVGTFPEYLNIQSLKLHFAEVLTTGELAPLEYTGDEFSSSTVTVGNVYSATERVIRYFDSGADGTQTRISEIFKLDNPVVIYKVTCKCTSKKVDWDSKAISEISIVKMTESVNGDFKAVSQISDRVSSSKILLKMFCKLPPKFPVNRYKCSWEYSDGNSWAPIRVHSTGAWYEDPDGQSVFATTLNPELFRTIKSPDVLSLGMLSDLGIPLNRKFRFRIFETSDNRISVVHSYFETFVPYAHTTEYLKTDLPNAVLGEKYYYKKSIYSYGTSEFNGIVHVSDTGSFITPLYNVLEVSTTAQAITCAIVPWRDYMLTFTENDIHLSNRAESGFYTKTVSTSVGVPFEDRYCVSAALNGVIFKSGTSIYFAYPNLYAGDDSSLNLTDISRPVQSILDDIPDNAVCRSYIIDDKYILTVTAKKSRTRCLAYDLSSKLWEYYEFDGVDILQIVKIANRTYCIWTKRLIPATDQTEILFEPYAEGLFLVDKYPTEVLDNLKIPEDTRRLMLSLGYGDILRLDNMSTLWHNSIDFMLDTGQKTDAIAMTKQFVESKLMFATLDERDTFPFRVYVAVDGDPHVITTDVSTDAAFWKKSSTDVIAPQSVLGTAFTLGGESTPASGVFNTLRQLVIRYSGKGKSIRHVIDGSSECNFKLYETYVRYKHLNGK